MSKIYLDFEGLPDENFIYLIGLITKQGETERQYSFWADRHEDEETIFVKLFETLAPFENFQHLSLRQLRNPGPETPESQVRQPL